MWNFPPASTTPAAHDLAGAEHDADTLANLNLKVSDATLDDSGDPRDPNAHDLDAHNAVTLAELSAIISDATLDDSSASRPPSAHSISGAAHTAAANLSAMLSLLGVSAGLLECIVNSTPLAAADPDDILDVSITGSAAGMLIFAGFCANDGASAATINLRLNGAQAIGTNRRITVTTTAAYAGAADGTCLLGFPLNGTASFWVTFIFPGAANSISRWAVTLSGGVNAGPISTLRIETYRITTPTAATEITSIGVDSNIADGLGIGTRLWVWGLTV